MTHEQAMPLVSDWARGALDADRAKAVEVHVSQCLECQASAVAARGLHAEAARLVHTPSAHPSSDALAEYVNDPQAASVTALARIGAHVRACPACREDVALMRAASRPAWWRAVLSAWEMPGGGARWLQPALAACALLLALPAWRGLVELPRERAALEQRVLQAEQARVRAETRVRDLAPASMPAIRGGGVAALVLQGAARNASALPTLRLRPGQLLQPILLDVSPPNHGLRVTLLRADGSVAWAAAGAREEYWDETNRLTGLLIPTSVLAPGEYRIEVQTNEYPAPFFTSRFEVKVATP